MATLLAAVCLVSAETSWMGGTTGPTGPFSIAHKTVTDPRLDITDHKIDIVYPINAAGRTFSLIAYAHGFSDEALESYPRLWPELASWGYVVAGTLACKFGCLGNCKTLPLDPPCFGHYYEEQLEVINWARDGNFGDVPLNLTGGVAVAGHSMGGQASLFSAAYNASSHNIRAAALHHAFTHTYPAIATIPFIAFTGTEDTTAPPEMAEKIFDAKGAFGTRGIVNKIGANHHEPTSDYNPKLANYTVAWFKLHLDNTPQADGRDYHAEIYGSGPDSLCKGGDGAMKECTVL